MRLIFMGSPDFSVATLQGLYGAGHEIVCVYSQPPRPAGRGQKERPCPVHSAAQTMGIAVRNPENFKSRADCQAFTDLQADMAVVVAYGLILPQAILSAPRLGCVNVHASLLPRWRGAAPIQRAILAGDKQTGVCIMAMERGLDTGAVYMRRSLAITENMTGGMLHDELSAIGAELCLAAVSAISDGTMTAQPQPQDGVTYATKLNSVESRLDWSQSASSLARAVLAFDPWPGTWFEHNGERIKVLAARAEPDAKGWAAREKGVSGKTNSGQVLDLRPTVACANGVLVLERLQRAGRKPQDAAEFMRGYPLAIGDDLV